MRLTAAARGHEVGRQQARRSGDGRHALGARDVQRHGARRRDAADGLRSGLRAGIDDPNPVSDAVLIAADGGLKNVFVYVKDGLDPAYGFDIPTTTVVLDQKGCRYTPRIVGVRAGQPIDIVNSDPTLHNVHALPMANPEFNQGQPIQGFRTTRTFTTPEVMVRFKCDVHSWMAAHVGVVAHPYFAITKDDGSFEIPNLPPGTYTIEAWHEKFGTQVAKVTIGDKQSQTTSFTFTAKAEG